MIRLGKYRPWIQRSAACAFEPLPDPRNCQKLTHNTLRHLWPRHTFCSCTVASSWPPACHNVSMRLSAARGPAPRSRVVTTGCGLYASRVMCVNIQQHRALSAVPFQAADPQPTDQPPLATRWSSKEFQLRSYSGARHALDLLCRPSLALEKGWHGILVAMCIFLCAAHAVFGLSAA